ncbi:MAG: hypothetical protein IJP17_07420 [Clostridia bacterium]|nr:hypothetical protein [Clostridia bacterium]
MKKAVIAILAIFAAVILLLVTVVAMNTQRVRFFKESYLHVSMLDETSEVVGTSANGAQVHMSSDNVAAFMKVVTAQSITYAFIVPSEEKNPSVSMLLPDGTKYTVIDGGEDKNGHDTAYIVYRSGRTKLTFRLTGFAAFDRAAECVSAMGSAGANTPLR